MDPCISDSTVSTLAAAEKKDLENYQKWCRNDPGDSPPILADAKTPPTSICPCQRRLNWSPFRQGKMSPYSPVVVVSVKLMRWSPPP